MRDTDGAVVAASWLAAMRPRPLIERVSSEDLLSLVADQGTVPMHVGAVLYFRTEPGFTARDLIDAIEDRLPLVPRLRQVLVPQPPGSGRPVWQDDAGFLIDRHIAPARCIERQAVLELAADLIVAPLPRQLPLWRARVVTGFAAREAALVLVVHHVLADGIAALAILSDLAGDHPAATDPAFPRPLPSRRALLADNLRGRVRGVLALPQKMASLLGALAVLRSRGDPAARTSLNRPTGPRRRYTSVWCDLAPALGATRAAGATINDLTLAAIAQALRQVLAARGEQVDRFVISVPFSARRSTHAGDLGNQSGVVPLSIPAAGDGPGRLREIAALTRRAKGLPRAAANAVLGPGFRGLARLGLFGWFIDRQRMVHTFATNLRGPAEPLELAGREVTEIVPLSVTTGNITVAFATFSYAGRLGITITADPDVFPELDMLRDAVAAALDAFLSSEPDGPPGWGN